MIHVIPPQNFVAKIEVVGCIMLDEKGRFLLLKRHENKPEGGVWGFPGGKVEIGESPTGAVLRESQEETGITLGEDISYLGKVYVDKESDSSQFVYHGFLYKIQATPLIKLNSSEHIDYGWFSRTEAQKIPLIHDLEACFDIFLP